MTVFVESNLLKDIMNKIRHIDPEKNGCVTTSEMDDILKELYPLKLGR